MCHRSDLAGDHSDSLPSPQGLAAERRSPPGGSCGSFQLAFMRGTSMATPIAAGAALLARQYFAEGWYPTGAPLLANAFNPSGALIKAVLIGQADPAGYTQGFLSSALLA